MVVNAERAKEMRRAGRGSKLDTGQVIMDELLTRGSREFGVFIVGLKKQNVNVLSDLLEEKHESSE